VRLRAEALDPEQVLAVTSIGISRGARVAVLSGSGRSADSSPVTSKSTGGHEKQVPVAI
jgi:hypothetical protein